MELWNRPNVAYRKPAHRTALLEGSGKIFGKTDTIDVSIERPTSDRLIRHILETYVNHELATAVLADSKHRPFNLADCQ